MNAIAGIYHFKILIITRKDRWPPPQAPTFLRGNCGLTSHNIVIPVRFGPHRRGAHRWKRVGTTLLEKKLPRNFEGNDYRLLLIKQAAECNRGHINYLKVFINPKKKTTSGRARFSGYVQTSHNITAVLCPFRGAPQRALGVTVSTPNSF